MPPPRAAPEASQPKATQMSLWSANDADAFPQQPDNPQLDRRACLSPRGLRSFLKLSRHSVDDVLKQRLDSLISHSAKTKQVDRQQSCTTFINDVVFPAWRSRLAAIEFCEEEASKIEAEIHKEIEEHKIIGNSDLRLDPYAQRDIDTRGEVAHAQINTLRSWIANEKEIESIVQSRTSQVLRDNCGWKMDWSKDFTKWSKSS